MKVRCFTFLLGLCRVQHSNGDFFQDDPATSANVYTMNMKPIQPSMTFPKNTEGKKLSFQAAWYKEPEWCDWLEYSKKNNSAYCFYCRIFSTPKITAFATNGFKKWKSARDSFSQHCKCESHLNAFEKV